MGLERLEKEMDIVKLQKKLRRLNQVLKEKFPWKNRKFVLEGQGKNVLDIDSEQEQIVELKDKTISS